MLARGKCVGLKNPELPKGYPWMRCIEEEGLSKSYKSGTFEAKQEGGIFTVIKTRDESFRITTPEKCGLLCVYVYNYENGSRRYLSFEGGQQMTSKKSQVPKDYVKSYDKIFAGIVDGMYTVVLEEGKSFRIKISNNCLQGVTVTNVGGKLVLEGENRILCGTYNDIGFRCE